MKKKERSMRLGVGDLPEHVLEDIRDAAVYSKVDRIVLYGSRARGTHRERSDIDIAVQGGDVDRLRRCLDEDTWTLLTFDVVDLDWKLSPELRADIAHDGILLYEKDH